MSTPTPISDEIVGINEAADFLGITPSLVRLYLRTKRLSGVKLTSRAWVIRRADLEAFKAVPRHAGGYGKKSSPAC